MPWISTSTLTWTKGSSPFVALNQHWKLRNKPSLLRPGTCNWQACARCPDASGNASVVRAASLLDDFRWVHVHDANWPILCSWQTVAWCYFVVTHWPCPAIRYVPQWQWHSRVNSTITSVTYVQLNYRLSCHLLPLARTCLEIAWSYDLLRLRLVSVCPLREVFNLGVLPLF